ncbi:hypothetical protein BJ742DRAFT_455550 [Cladochytrium replicatum]|nr:hypothetical protein BJ742DRAFT_455550 [Cladochytrium replicatum]
MESSSDWCVWPWSSKSTAKVNAASSTSTNALNQNLANLQLKDSTTADHPRAQILPVAPPDVDRDHNHLTRVEFESGLKGSWVRQIFGKRIGAPITPSHLIDWSNRKVIDTSTLPPGSEPPRYTCISHVWGRVDPDEQHAHVDLLGLTDGPNSVVEVSPEKMRLTKQFLENAGLEGKLLWLDLTCLPQDLPSKYAQVPLMGKYFYYADEVICWVEQPTVDRLRDLMAEEKLINDRKVYTAAISQEAFKAFEERGFSTVDNALAFRDIISETAWFGRVWTLQEMLLANKAWLVSMSGERVLMSDLGRLSITAIRTLGAAQIVDAGHLNDLVYTSDASEASPFSCMTMCAVDVIRAAQRRDCRFEEDRLYGILGLFATSGNIEVAYGDLAHATDIVLSAIVRAGDLSLLGLIGAHSAPLMRPLITNGLWFACDCIKLNRSQVSVDIEYADGKLAVSKANLSEFTFISPKSYQVTNLTMERVFARTLFGGVGYSPLSGDFSTVTSHKITELNEGTKKIILGICGEEFGNPEAADTGLTNVHASAMRVIWIHQLKGIGFLETSVKTGEVFENRVLVPPTWQTSRGGVSALVCGRPKIDEESDDIQLLRTGTCITDCRMITKAGRRSSLVTMKRIVVG